MKKRSDGRRTDNDLRNSGKHLLEHWRAAALVSLTVCPPSRVDLLDPDAVKLVPPRRACIGIHYPRPLCSAVARRLARSSFRAIFFGPRGNICGSCEAVDRRRDSRTRQVLTFRGSPSPANYACLFLPLLLFLHF